MCDLQLPLAHGGRAITSWALLHVLVRHLTRPGNDNPFIFRGYYAVGRGSPRSGGGSAARGALVEQKLNIT
ncbi:hypothetical protein ACFWAD_03870 [Rhodococcus sp. NPDC059969]|uniref:hypothetical protein n=1 Tax=Rhodococcus sp. NPDC059969 TaxID=3347018 RepID=UPI0036720F2E